MPRRPRHLKPPAHFLLCLVLAVGPAALAQAYVAAPTPVRVLLATAPEVTVIASGPHRVITAAGRATTPAGLAWPVTVRGGALVVDGHDVGANLTFEADGGTLEVAGRRYRGSIRLSAVGDAVEVVNVLDLEAYLRGVVPAEMAASWPLEALKAQAVAARSYTLTSLDPTARYDLCATDECQVYRGVEAEHPRTDEAIAATAGVVVTYQGEAARTYYHSDSGGAVASSQEVWGTRIPYLVAFQDVQTSGPHRAWTARLDPRLVSASLAAAGVGVGAVTSLRVVRVSESGRVAALEVMGSGGSRVLEGVQLRSLARGWGLKSMRFSVTGGLDLKGAGWGHGVGMSQYGARALALSGYDYGRILGHYYPTTALTRFVAGGR